MARVEQRKVKRKDGKVVKTKTWRAKVFLGKDASGKWLYATQTFDTKGEAETWGKEQELKHKQGTYIPPSKETVKEFALRWLSDTASTRLRERTLDQYSRNLRLHVIEEAIGKMRMERVTLAAVDTLYATLRKREKKLSARSIRYVHGVLRTMFNSAVQGKVILTNPCDHATLPRQQHKEAMFLSPQQVQKLLDAAKDDPWWTYWLVLARTGMRPSEALGLQWRDIGEKSISINRTVVRHVGKHCQVKGCKHWKYEDCKTVRSRRTIDIASDVQRALKTHRGVAGVIGADTRLVFPGEHDAPPDMRSLVRLHFDPYREAADLPECSPYVLRHSHISDLLAQGVPVVEVSRRVGHSSPVMTLSVYGHVLPSSGERMMAALERASANG